MNVTISPECEEIVRNSLASGSFANAEQVVNEGLRALKAREEWRAKIKQGLKDAEEGRLLTPKQVKENMARRREEWLASARK